MSESESASLACQPHSRCALLRSIQGSLAARSETERGAGGHKGSCPPNKHGYVDGMAPRE